MTAHPTVHSITRSLSSALLVALLVAGVALPLADAALQLGLPLVTPAAACSGSTNTIYFKGYDPDTLSSAYTNNETVSLDRDTTQPFNAACDGKTY